MKKLGGKRGAPRVNIHVYMWSKAICGLLT